MSDQGKHTELPWEADIRTGCFAIFQEGQSPNCMAGATDTAIIYQQGRGEESSPGCYKYLTAEQEANAAFIVEACNNYEALQQRVTELEAELTDAKRRYKIDVIRTEQERDKARRMLRGCQQRNAELVKIVEELLEVTENIDGYEVAFPDNMADVEARANALLEREKGEKR